MDHLQLPVGLAPTSDFVKQYEKNPNFHTRITPTNGYLSFNIKKKVTGNVHIRRAISQAIDKRNWLKLFCIKVKQLMVL